MFSESMRTLTKLKGINFFFPCEQIKQTHNTLLSLRFIFRDLDSQLFVVYFFTVTLFLSLSLPFLPDFPFFILANCCRCYLISLFFPLIGSADKTVSMMQTATDKAKDAVAEAMDNKSEYIVISKPRNFHHESHIGLSAGGVFEVPSIFPCARNDAFVTRDPLLGSQPTAGDAGAAGGPRQSAEEHGTEGHHQEGGPHDLQRRAAGTPEPIPP